MKKGAIVNSTTHSTNLGWIDRAWFSRLVRHPDRKLSGSILTTGEPARGLCSTGKQTELFDTAYREDVHVAQYSSSVPLNHWRHVALYKCVLLDR